MLIIQDTGKGVNLSVIKYYMGGRGGWQKCHMTIFIGYFSSKGLLKKAFVISYKKGGGDRKNDT